MRAWQNIGGRVLNMLQFIKQIIKYESTAIVGGAIDYGLLILLIEIFDVHYLIASVISLLSAMIVQYILNIRFVFDTRREHLVRKFIGYAVLGAIGIGLNTLIIYIAVHHLGLHYLPSKVCASVIVGLYNFTSRKLYLERPVRLFSSTGN